MYAKALISREENLQSQFSSATALDSRWNFGARFFVFFFKGDVGGTC